MKTAAPRRSGLPPLRMAIAPQIGVAHMAVRWMTFLMTNKCIIAPQRLRRDYDTSP